MSGEAASGSALEITAFTCTRCGNCCRVPGYVRLMPGEVEMAADFLGMGVHAFTREFTRLTNDRAGLSLTEKDDGSCIFLDADNACRIQAVKPKQCRDFPLSWQFEGFERICPGVTVVSRADKPIGSYR